MPVIPVKIFPIMIPQLETDSLQTDRTFRIAVGDVLGNVVSSHVGLAQGGPSLMAGLTYEAWTRDAAINTWNGLPAFWPEIARATLLGEVTGEKSLRGQYWDAVVWVTGAWHYFLWTGDVDFLATAREVSANWLARMEREELASDGLFRGAACFQDGISGYGDRYAMCGGSSCITDWVAANPDQSAHPGTGLPMHALSTNCLYFRAYEILGEMDRALGRIPDPRAAESAARLRVSILKNFRIPKSELFRYYVDPWGSDDRQEGMGHAYALMFGLVDDTRKFVEAVRQTPAGLPCLWPGYGRYDGTQPRARYGRHAGLVWPQVQALWADACAGAGCFEAAFAEMDHLAEKALRDGNFFECYHPDDGLPEGGVQEIEPGAPADWHSWCLLERHETLPGGPLLRWVSQPRTTWGATGYMRLVLNICAGLRPMVDRLELKPHLPRGMNRLHLAGLRWRAATLDLTVTRRDSDFLYLDGQPVESIPAGLTGPHRVEVGIPGSERGQGIPAPAFSG